MFCREPRAAQHDGVWTFWENGAYTLTGKRIFYIDLIRAVAILSVLGIHSFFAKYPERVPHNAFDTAIYLPSFMFGLSGVGLFVMISGALIIEKEIRDGFRFYWKRIAAFGGLLAFWSVFGNSVAYICQGMDAWQAVLASCLHHSVIIGGSGYQASHLWFLPMIMHLYLAAPFLARMVQCMPVRDYVIFATISAVLFLLPGTFNYDGSFATLLDADFFGIMGRYDVFGVYVSWFILGYLFSRYDMDRLLAGFSKRYSRYLALILLVSALTGGYAEYKLTVRHDFQIYVPLIQFYKSLFMYVNVVVIFLLLKHYAGHFLRFRRQIEWIARYAFGLYLIHLPMISVSSLLLQKVGINTDSSILVITPLCGILTFGLSSLLCMLLYRFKYTRYLIR